MLGFSGKKDEELALLAKGRETLRGLEERGTKSGAPSEGYQEGLGGSGSA